MPIPRFLASDQKSGSPNWTEAIPPHADMKSPVSSSFTSSVQGAWSDTTMETTPSSTALQSCSRCLGSRTGGQHLNCVAPAGTQSELRFR